jgi:hypothetical protein
MTTSKRQGMCVWLAFIVVFGLALFPPWVQTNTSYSAWPTQRWKLGHAPFSPSPAPPDRRSFIEVDYPRMLTEIGVAECFVLALYLTWGNGGRGRNRTYNLSVKRGKRTICTELHRVA